MSELVEVFHELSNPDSLLLHFPSDPSQKVFEVLGYLVPDGAFDLLGLMLEVNKTVSIGFRYQLSIFIVLIHILDELVVVHLVQVASVHVLFQQKVELSVILRDKVELFQYSGELVFRHIPYFSDVEILKHGLQVDSFVSYGSLII